MDVKKLGVVVEQKGIAPTAKNLERLAKASESAQQPLERLSSTLGGFKSVNLDKFSSKLQDTTQAIKDVKASTSGLADMAKNIGGLSVNLTNIANATERLSAKTADVAAYVTQMRALRVELEGMRGLSSNIGRTATGGSRGSKSTQGSPQYDPGPTNALTAAQQRLMTQLERTALMVGKTKAEYLAARAAQLGLTDLAAPFISKIKTGEKAMNGLTISTKQANAALRMVPAQFTDIATQLAGGQNPFLILLQQGGQMRDMFMGFGNMFKMIGPMMGKFLINPFVLAAVAIGTFGYSLYKSQSELSAFNKAMITTNNISGMTVASFYGMKKSISAIAGDSVASEALLAIAASGKIASGSIEGVGLAAAKMSKVTGQDVAETVKEFESLGQKPAEAIVKLNDKYHFLTASIYENIVSLEKQGKTIEATKLATESLQDAVDAMEKESVKRAGSVERAWLSVKNVFIDIKDSILSIGNGDIVKELATIEKGIASYQKQLASSSSANSLNPSIEDMTVKKELEALKTKRAEILKTTAIDMANTSAKVAAQKEEEKGITSRQAFDKIAESNMDKQAKKQKELTDLKKAYAGIVTKTAQDELNYQKALSAIDEKYKDKGAGKEQRRTDARELEKNAIEGSIEALLAEIEALDKNGLAYDKSSQHMQNAAKWWKQVNDPKVSDSSKRLAIENALLEERADMYQKIRDQKIADLKAEESFNEVYRKNAQEIADLNTQYEQEAKYITMTNKEKQAAQALFANEVAMNKALLELEKQRKNVKGNSVEEGYLNDSIANTRKAYAEKEKLINANLALQEKELTWMENITVASKQYSDNLGTHNSQVQGSMLEVIGTVEGALTDFVSNTKTSFKDLTVSVLKQLAVMFAKMALMKVAMAGLGLLQSFSVPSNANTTIPMQPGGGYAKGGAFTSTGVAKFANGGAFTNSVVSRPTSFKFANGGAFNTGVMGEAGPEAVMPLTRAANGKLGVESSGTGGTQNNISVNVNMNSNGTATTTTESTDNSSAKAMGDLIARKVKETIASEQRPGGLLATR